MCTGRPLRTLRCDRCEPDLSVGGRWSSWLGQMGSVAAALGVDGAGVVGRDRPRMDSPKEVLRGLGRRMPKMLIRLPFRDELDLDDSSGTTWATSSAVAVGPDVGAGIAMCSGVFLLRGRTVVFVVAVVLDIGREGERVAGREGPAMFPLVSCSRLEWRA